MGQDALASTQQWADLLSRSMGDSFPWWNNVNDTPGAMRATGFRHRSGSTLLFEVLVYATRLGELQRLIYAYSPDRDDNGFLHADTLVGEGGFVEYVDEATVRSRVTGVVRRTERAGRKTTERILVPKGGIASCFELEIGKAKHVLPLELPDMKGVELQHAEQWQRLFPEEVVLFQLCDRAKPSQLFCSKGQLKKLAALPAKATSLFALDAWRHPAAPGDDDSSIAALCEALAKGQKPKKVSKPNTNWRCWLDDLLQGRSPDDAAPWWGVGGEPLGEEKAPQRKSAAGRATTRDKPAKWLDHKIHPTWDAPSAPCAAMRASGFVTDDGPALIIEAIVAPFRTREVRRETHGYGPGAPAAGKWALLQPTHVLVPPEAIYEGEEGGAKCRVARGKTLSLDVAGRGVKIQMSLPVEVSNAERAYPSQVVAYRLAERSKLDLFASDDVLVEMAGMRNAKRLFAFDDWQHVATAAPLSKSPDLRAMAAALEQHNAPDTLKGKASGGWRKHVGKLLRHYGKRERDLWP